MAQLVSNPVVVIGAFERHNFGDLLMGRIVEWLLRQHGLTPLPASLVAADLRRLGGSWVHSFADLAPCLSAGVPLVHVGGETIPCSLTDGLRMNIPAAWPNALASRLAADQNPSGLESREFAYLTPLREIIRGQTCQWRHRFFHAQGASTLGQRDTNTCDAVSHVLGDAAWVTARDDVSVTGLRESGVAHARFAWDSAVLQPCLDAQDIAALNDVPPRPSHGPLLVQANADFLRHHADQLVPKLAAVAGRFSGIRVALAGLAAHHDTAASAEALTAALVASGCHAEYARTQHADEIVDGIKTAACVVATSLHYRIISLTYGVPRVSLLNAKTANWARSCDPDFPSECAPQDVVDAIANAMAVPAHRAAELALTARRESLASVQAMMNAVSPLARSSEACCQLPAGHTNPQLPLPPDHQVLPRAWIDALGDRWETLSEQRTSAQEGERKAREEMRRLREELAALKRSPAGRVARFFRR